VVVAHYQRESYWLGIFGLHPKPTNFTNYTDSSPSYMSMLFDNKRIPSKSFGYTAGSKNRKFFDCTGIDLRHLILS